MKTNEKIKCEKCGEILDPEKVKWLELSNTDGNYYVEIPKEHVSQGSFSFGTTCASKQLNETLQNTKFGIPILNLDDDKEISKDNPFIV